MSLYVAAYDVADDRRRRATAKVLSRYGHRVQESVFELWLEPEEVAELRGRLGPVLAAEDRLDLYPIDLRGSRTHYRWFLPIDEWDCVLLR
jgi:CRISPR-associated protein Cas2